MKVTAQQSSNVLKLKFITEDDDRLQPNNKYKMVGNKCEFHLPKGFSLEELHPDHFGLVVLMLCTPFVGKRLILPKPISEQFHQATKVISRFEVGPMDSEIEPYVTTSDSRPALAFSGGVDSTAALALMPEETVCIFLDRPIRKGSLYDKDAPLKICENLSADGREVHLINTDLEYLRQPTGFPVDVANSAPAVLLAELLSFNSIAFGTIMESAYGVGHANYRYYPNGNHYRTWGSLFKGAGIPLNLTVAGLSEVSTSRLMVNHPIGALSQSCIRGKWNAPCRNCWKCFRKILLDTVLRGEKLSDELLDEMFSINEAIHHLNGFPIKHENILIWITSRYHGNHKLMNLLKRRVRGDILDLSWLECWNMESEEVLHSSTKNHVIQEIGKYFADMDEEMLVEMKSWDMNPMLEDPIYQELRRELSARLS